jgi:hypothetical protein
VGERPGMEAESGVDLYWLPLGAGGRSVRINGRVFEWLSARRARRSPLEIYHAALEVRVPEARYVIEMTPVPDAAGARRGVVGEGAVGTRWAVRLRVFRYELRCWRDGRIPDVAEAIGSPVRVSAEPFVARRILELAPFVPTAVWGRDELGTGEMWTSNSVIAWLLVGAGLAVDPIRPPAGGRAPGWDAGITVARASSLGRERLLQRPSGQHLREVLAELGARTRVARGRGPFRGPRGRCFRTGS